MESPAERIMPRERELVLPSKYGGKKIRVPLVRSIEERRGLTPHNRELRRKLERADPEEAQRLKVREALKHLKEQKAKGNVVNGEKKKGFQAHQLPEINSILYGFKYDSKAPRSSIAFEEYKVDNELVNAAKFR